MVRRELARLVVCRHHTIALTLLCWMVLDEGVVGGIFSISHPSPQPIWGNALTFRLYHTLSIVVKIFNLRFNERRNLFFEISLTNYKFTTQRECVCNLHVNQ
jgi:hypothetical protein